MSDTPSLTLWIAFTFFLAGMVKGVVGMGLPTVAMGLLSLALAPAGAAATRVMPSLVTNVWQFAAGPSARSLSRRLLVMMLAIYAGTFAGIGILASSAKGATLFLGLVLAIYGTLGLVAPRFSVSAHIEPVASPVVGLATGLLSGATGVFVIPAVPYLSALGLTRDELMQALGLSFTISTLALGLALIWRGQFPLSLAGGSLAAVIPALAGMVLGQRVRERLHAEVFRRWFFASLIILGLGMAIRTLI